MRGDLLRKSCHETGSREPINAMDFLPWHYLNWEGAVVVVVVVVVGGFAKKETDTNQSLWRHLDYTSPPTPSIHPHSPTCHHQPLPPSSPLLFICFSVFSVVCLPLGWKLCVYAPLCMCVLVCVCVCVCVRERSEMTHWFTVFYIFSSGSLLQCESIDAIILSASLSLFILSPCFSPSLSLFLSLSLFFLWLSEYHVVEWKCLRGVLYCRYRRRGLEYQRCVLYLCVPVCISVYHILTRNTVLSIQECMLLFVHRAGACDSAEAYTVHLTARLSRCQIPFVIYKIYIYIYILSEYLYVWGRLCWWVFAPCGLYARCTSSSSATPPCDPHVHAQPHARAHTATHPPTCEDFCQNQ